MMSNRSLNLSGGPGFHTLRDEGASSGLSDSDGGNADTEMTPFHQNGRRELTFGARRSPLPTVQQNDGRRSDQRATGADGNELMLIISNTNAQLVADISVMQEQNLSHFESTLQHNLRGVTDDIA